ncbi:MAG TPA: mycothiol synthase [Arachnia sp.]|nr:mycothiol synthase [Arachnia sp.]HMT85508.1 mycothiol synthase [Arachnia sp.]
MEATASPARRTAAKELLTAIEAADGISPVNESGLLILDGHRPGVVLLDEHAVAVLDPREGTAMLGVHPAHRRRGLGGRMLAEVLRRQPSSAVWAFGTRPGATELCARHGLAPRRELLKMARPLDPGQAVSQAPGYEIVGYRDSDAEDVVAINRIAFAHHPEQGLLTVDEFRQLTAQPWFRADGLLIATRDGEAAGFHWTKRHGQGVGEVYVIAVHPDHGGGGLGRALLESGLAHLAAQGDHTVELYVEADQPRVVAIYRKAGFEVVRVDTSFAKETT